MPHVSLHATLVGTILGFLLGGIWYGPLFGKAWMAENGFTPEYIEQAKQTFNPVKSYGGMFVLGLIAAYVFGMFLGPKPGLGFAIGAGLAAGVCWVATAFASTYLWEGRSPRHLLINGGYHALRFGLIGLAFGLLG